LDTVKLGIWRKIYHPLNKNENPEPPNLALVGKTSGRERCLSTQTAPGGIFM
jgi:hypothetical protein